MKQSVCCSTDLSTIFFFFPFSRRSKRGPNAKLVGNICNPSSFLLFLFSWNKNWRCELDIAGFAFCCIIGLCYVSSPHSATFFFICAFSPFYLLIRVDLFSSIFFIFCSAANLSGANLFTVPNIFQMSQSKLATDRRYFVLIGNSGTGFFLLLFLLPELCLLPVFTASKATQYKNAKLLCARGGGRMQRMPNFASFLF